MAGVLLALLPWVGACGDAGGAGDTRVPQPDDRATLRLWRDLAPVEHDVPSSSKAVVPHETRSLLVDPSVSWQRIVAGDDGITYVPADVDGSLRLPAAEAQRGGFVTSVPVREGEALVVRLRVRVVGAEVGRKAMVAALVQRREPFDPGERLDQEAVARMFDPSRFAVSALSIELDASGAAGEVQELRHAFLADVGSTELALYLLASEAGAGLATVVDEVVLERVGTTAHLLNGGDVPRLTWLDEAQGSTPSAVRVRMDRDEREGLLALAPSRFAWDLPACDVPRRLDLAIGVRPRDATLEGSIRYRVSVGGDELAVDMSHAPSSPAEPAWTDLRFTLPASPDGPQRLELSTMGQGSDPPLCVFGHPTVRRARTGAPPNVVLISLDTLRPDRLGSYGGVARRVAADGEGQAVEISRHLDALAADGLRFTNAYSTTSYTLPSHASMLTGQYPAFHGAVDITDRLSTARSPFLARMLSDVGYATAAFTGGGYVSTDYGFGEGFDRYSLNDPVWALGTVRGRQLIGTIGWQRSPVNEELLARYDTRAVAGWLQEQQPGMPFFAFLHTYIVHNYAPSTAWMERLGLWQPGQLGRPFDHRLRSAYNARDGDADAAGTDGPEREALRARVYDAYMPYYDATIGMADDFVGSVLAALRRAGVADNTIVIVTSDHGEEFGEHGFFGHGESLYDANTRVPFIAFVPGMEPAVIDDPVSLVDIAPWVLRLVGLEPAPSTIADPLGPTRDSPPKRDTVVMELDTHLRRLSAVREGDLKLHVRFDPDDGEQQRAFYDLVADAGEQRDLLAPGGPLASGDDDGKALRAAAERIRTRLQQFHKIAAAAGPGEGSERTLHDLDPDMLIQLMQLGYISAEDVSEAMRGRDG